MLLAVDVGNTNTNFAIIDNGEFKAFFAITTKLPRTSDEFSAAIREQLWVNQLPVESIDGCIVASVVPAIMHSLINGIIKLTGIRPMEVGAGTKTGIKIRLANTSAVPKAMQYLNSGLRTGMETVSPAVSMRRFLYSRNAQNERTSPAAQ